MSDARKFAPAAARNRDPILEVLRRVIPPSARVLEIASGSGEHAVHFARALPSVRWTPSDADPEALESIRAWRDLEGLQNLDAPLLLDVTLPPWPVDAFEVIFCANMIHIAPWEACAGLARGAGQHVVPGGQLVVYGPFRVSGAHTAESNAAFDASLRARDPAWGVRDVDDVARECARHGFALAERVAMPANNQILAFRRAGATP